METETFVEKVKVGVGVVAVGFLRKFFFRMIRGLIILERKLRCAIKKRLQSKNK